MSAKRSVCVVRDSKTSIQDLHILRYHMFTKSHTSSDKLPPTEDSLKQHIMHANYQSYTWYNADKPILNLPSPNENGWTFNNEEELIPLMMTKLPAPVPATILELTDCGCKGNCGNNSCIFKKIILCCTDSCKCSIEQYINCCSHEQCDSNNEGSDWSTNPQILVIIRKFSLKNSLSVFASQIKVFSQLSNDSRRAC